MQATVRGARPRPRVALVGAFDSLVIERYKQIFPTVWVASNAEALKQQVDSKELDLLVIGSDCSDPYIYDYSQSLHVICFSANLDKLPGPTQRSYINNQELAQTEEYKLPPLSLLLHHRREIDLGQLKSVKEWPKLTTSVWGQSMSERQRAAEILGAGTVVRDAHTDASLAAIYKREHNGLGLAWLPSSSFEQVEWTKLLAMEWAQSDREHFPNFGDWTKSPEWMTREENMFVERIDALEREKLEAIKQFDQQIAELTAESTQATLAVNEGRRRLLTAQGDQLVDEVAKAFDELGFRVELVDESLDSTTPKREDLRLRDALEPNSDWEAIVEVRGYAKSGGKANDFQRIAVFATMYMREKGRLPDKRIYVVNGPIELPPSQRGLPLASASEDVATFGDSDGVVISTLDLFRVLETSTPEQLQAVRNSIKSACGQWSLQALDSE